MIKKVLTVGISQMGTPLLAAFHHAVCTLVTGEQYAGQGIVAATTLADYVAAIEALQDYANRATSNDYAARLKTLDDARMAKFRLVRNRLKLQADQMDDAQPGSGESTRILVVDAYGEVGSVDMQTRTGLIRGFVMDVAALPAEVLATASVSTLLSALTQANSRFETTWLEKMQMQAAMGKSQLPALKARVNDVYRHIVLQVEAAANTTDTGEEAQVRAALATMLMGEMSQVARRYRTLLKVRNTYNRKAAERRTVDIETEPTADVEVEAVDDTPEACDTEAPTGCGLTEAMDVAA